jgi:hypothetical protein
MSNKNDDRWFVLRIKTGGGTSLIDTRIVGGPYLVGRAAEIARKCAVRYGGSKAIFILVEHLGEEFSD